MIQWILSVYHVYIYVWFIIILKIETSVWGFSKVKDNFIVNSTKCTGQTGLKYSFSSRQNIVCNILCTQNIVQHSMQSKGTQWLSFSPVRVQGPLWFNSHKSLLRDPVPYWNPRTPARQRDAHYPAVKVQYWQVNVTDIGAIGHSGRASWPHTARPQSSSWQPKRRRLKSY